MNNFDYSTTYLGLKLKNPLIISACSKTRDIEMNKRFEELGASAIVLPSLFEEEITFTTDQLQKYFLESSHLSFEGSNFMPHTVHENLASEDDYLELIHKTKKNLSIPVIASLNAHSLGGWVNYAKKIQEAKADALELNIYFMATNPQEDSFQVENRYLQIIKEVRRQVSLPIAIKVAPYFSSFANMAKKIEQENIQGLVLFNRFLEPDFDLENLEVDSTLEFSQGQEMRLSLHWTALLYNQSSFSLCSGRGVKNHRDFLKLLLAGADCVSIASVLYQEGPQVISKILKEAKVWLEEKEYQSINQLKGSMSYLNVSDREKFERANYMKLLKNKFD